MKLIIFFLTLNLIAAEKPEIQFSKHGFSETYRCKNVKVSRNVIHNTYTGIQEIRNFNGILIGFVNLKPDQAKIAFEDLKREHFDWQKVLK